MKTILCFHFLFLLGFSVFAQVVDTGKNFYIDSLFTSTPEVLEPQDNTTQWLIEKWYKRYCNRKKDRDPILGGWWRITKGDNLKMTYDVFSEYQIPYSFFVFMGIVESGCKDSIRNSISGATGRWQLMPLIAQHYGLVKDESKGIDER